MELQVTTIQQRCVGVKSFELRSPEGHSLPGFEPGAHVRVTIPGLGQPNPDRAYSLVSDHSDLTRYEIAVLQVQGGSGGSAALHQRVRPGDRLEVSSPKNEFRIDRSAEHSILIAGGIGITPILSLARELATRGDSFSVHYIGRGLDRMPYRDTLLEIAKDRVKLYTSRAAFDIPDVIRRSHPRTYVYVCGPYSLIETVREIARGGGIAASRIHFESFGYRRMPGDREIELVLRSSGISILAKPGRSMMEAIEAAGVWTPAECRRGACGTCAATIVEGRGDHRDHCLSAEQRFKAICTCVSWAAGDRLVLDI